MRQQQFQRQMQDADGDEKPKKKRGKEAFMYPHKTGDVSKNYGIEAFTHPSKVDRIAESFNELLLSVPLKLHKFMLDGPSELDDWSKIYKEFSTALKGQDANLVGETSEKYATYLDTLKDKGLIDDAKYNESVNYAKNDFERFFDKKNSPQNTR